jgi:hypothetical protein
MGSSYTDNNKFEKIGTGEQAGTWGTTTNLNFDMIDRAINGVTSIGLTGTTSTITTSDGTLTDGLFKVLQFTGSLSAGHTVTIAPNSVKKLYFVKNASGDTLTFIQGTGGTVGNGRAVAIENNKTGIIFCDGTGSDSTAKVQSIETGSDDFTTDVNIKTDDGALLTLETGDTSITAGDVLGALQFRAPSETDGTDAIAVAGAIVAEAKAAFSATDASTDLVFKVGTDVADDNAAVEKMRLTHDGDLEVKAADGAILKLLTGDTDIASSDVLGAIEFQAPDEGTGTDAIVAAGRIEVQSEGDFSATNNAAMIVFKTGADGDSAGTPTEKFRIESTGSCGIAADGSTTTNHLRLGASADLKIFHDGTDSKIINSTGHLKLLGDSIALNNAAEGANLALFTAGGASKLYFNGSEKLATSSAGVSVTGALTASGDITAFSDERLKSDIETIDNALDKVMNMRGVSYTKQAEKGIGVIAQEIEKVLPEVVTDGEYKSVAYGNIVGVLIEAIKEQQKQIDELKKDK